MISHWLGWISLILFGILLLKFMSRIRYSSEKRKIVRKWHKVCGCLMLATAFLHGITAGNHHGVGGGGFMHNGAGRGFVQHGMAHGSVFFSLNLGTAAFVVAVMVALCYVFRKKLKGKWLKLHRYGSLLLVFLVMIHVLTKVL